MFTEESRFLGALDLPIIWALITDFRSTPPCLACVEGVSCGREQRGRDAFSSPARTKRLLRRLHHVITPCSLLLLIVKHERAGLTSSYYHSTWKEFKKYHALTCIWRKLTQAVIWSVMFTVVSGKVLQYKAGCSKLD